MSDIDPIVEALQRRIEALEDEAARLRQPAAQRPVAPFSGNRRQILLGGAGMLGALAGSALLGRADSTYAASADSVPATSGTSPHKPEKHLSLQATLVPLKTRGTLWANHKWEFGAHFAGERPPVVVATACDDYMEYDVTSYCVCAVVVDGKPGAYHATIMVRNISVFATQVMINAMAFGV